MCVYREREVKKGRVGGRDGVGRNWKSIGGGLGVGGCEVRVGWGGWGMWVGWSGLGCVWVGDCVGEGWM